MSECGCTEICRMGWDDQFQPATRELLVFTKSAKRYFDLDSVRVPYVDASRYGKDQGYRKEPDYAGTDVKSAWTNKPGFVLQDRGGAPPLDWWQIPSPKPQPITPYEGPPMTATMYIGDVLDVLGKLPENSVDLVLSSPPFLALRSYLPADHPLKEKEGGSQSTPGEYIDWLLDVVEACDRVLAPHGSLCFELGDTYAGSGGAGGDYDPGGWREGQEAFEGSGKRIIDAKYERVNYGGHAASIANLHGKKQRGGTNWPLPKSLSLIPESFRFAMVYGFNPFTGRQTERWRLRNVIRWVRPNPPVGALGDKFRPATSELMVFCKSGKRYFDLDAVRSPHTEPGADRQLGGRKSPNGGDWTRDEASGQNPAGAPPLDWWNVPLVEGEEPKKMGPKPQPPRTTTGGKQIGRNVAGNDADPNYRPNYEDRPLNPAGAPPLDWWNIPLLEGEEPTKYGPEPPKSRDAYVRRRGESLVANPRRGDYGDPVGEVMGSSNPLGSPPLDWWEITPANYSGAHYAVWPPELLIKPIKAMCPEQVCRTCGEPRRRITEPTEDYAKALGRGFTDHTADAEMGQSEAPKDSAIGTVRRKGLRDVLGLPLSAQMVTTGFSDCGHDNYRPGLVLDPFVGSGTTLAVATGHGRDAIGIDLDERNYSLALERVGPLVLQRGEVAA